MMICVMPFISEPHIRKLPGLTDDASVLHFTPVGVRGLHTEWTAPCRLFMLGLLTLDQRTFNTLTVSAVSSNKHWGSGANCAPHQRQVMTLLYTGLKD